MKILQQKNVSSFPKTLYCYIFSINIWRLFLWRNADTKASSSLCWPWARGHGRYEQQSRVFVTNLRILWDDVKRVAQ